MSTNGQSALKTEARPLGLSLLANFSWTFAGNVVYAACQWGMIIVLTKLGSPEMVGQFTLGLAVTAPIILFANLQLRNIQATDAKQEFAFSHYLGLRLTTTTLAFLFIIAAVLVARYQEKMALVILVLGLAKSFEAISDVFYGLLQKHERMDWIAKSLMIKGLLSLIALGAGVYFSGELIWGLVGMVIVWASILIFYDYPSSAKIVLLSSSVVDSCTSSVRTVDKICLQWEWSTLRRLAKVAFPLGVVTMLVSLNSNIPRYLIGYHWGESELGIYAAMAYLMIMGSTVVSALARSTSPRLSKYYAAGNYVAFKSLLLKMVGLGVSVGATGILLAALVGREFITLVYRPEYARQDVFVLLMIAAGINYTVLFLNHGMTAARYFRIQLPLSVTVVAVTFLIGFWMIPLIGLQGAALSLIGGAVVQMILSCLVVSHSLKVNAV